MSEIDNRSQQSRLCWLVPGERAGGIIWVADSCCRQSAAEGYEVTLLTMEPLSTRTRQTANYSVNCLNVISPYTDTPKIFLDWVTQNRPDVLFINGCDTMDDCIPYLPPEVRCVYVVHDTMSFYWKRAVKYEKSLDAIVAVSNATASRFRGRLKHPERLHVIQNGTVFPPRRTLDSPSHGKDLVFLGGSDSRKGAYDLVHLWPILVESGYSGRLHWYGQMAEDIKLRIATLPASDQIMTYGHVPRTEVLLRLESSSVLLMLSRAEACSIALLEGMSMGCVPVAWDINDTGTKEIVKDGHRFLAPLGDYNALAKQTLLALEHHDAVTEGIATHARTEFAESRMWRDYGIIINQIVTQPLAIRPCEGQSPPDYEFPIRTSQLIPRRLWKFLKPRIAKSPRLYYFLRKKL
ncbi:glycosyltransferase family 4 protein [Bythopirellula polymerisocia]|uniref:Glycosyltransferase Gtf1 n=1 Tax=Bythopirellula polymerisocia TaxID=2528003 RepID=A0A5C6CQJ6_9BACT|nr:glycosyltransferase family 4 protein [Bythopirellula polymerisocia]TWU25794.1 Glycosyltransferase Gtf1 [Bythopirellula polymerisocia]